MQQVWPQWYSKNMRRQQTWKAKLENTTTIIIVSQAAWYRMENSRKWGKNGRKIDNYPRPEMWKKKQSKTGQTVETWPQIRFCVVIEPFFPFSGRVQFSMVRPFFPIIGFRPVFHSIPGRLTRKTTTNNRTKNILSEQLVTANGNRIEH